MAGNNLTDAVKKTAIASFFIILCASQCAVYADDGMAGDTPQMIRYMNHGTPRYRTGLPYESAKKTLLGNGWEGGRPWLTYEPSEGYTVDALDLSIRPSTVYVLQGAPNPNLSPGTGKLGSSWVMYVDFEKKFGEWGLFFLELETGWGDTVQKDLALFSNVNHNAYDVERLDLRKWRYEQYLFEKQVTLKCGKLRAMDSFDRNNYAEDDDVQFLGNLFNNSPAVEWPSQFSFGEEVNVALDAVNFLELDLGHYEGNDDWQQLFKHGMYIAQTKLKPAELFGLDPAQWTGNYRFYGWANNRFHSKYVDEGESQGEGKYINYGLGMSFDQMVGKKLGVFGRFGWQRPDLKPAGGGPTVEWAWSGGIQICGVYWKRTQDHLSISVGQDFVGTEYKDAGNPGSNEGHIEAYYSWKLNMCLTISPDIQLVWNPNGVSKSWQGDAEPVFVYATRVHYVF